MDLWRHFFYEWSFTNLTTTMDEFKWIKGYRVYSMDETIKTHMTTSICKKTSFYGPQTWTDVLNLHPQLKLDKCVVFQTELQVTFSQNPLTSTSFLQINRYLKARSCDVDITTGSSISSSSRSSLLTDIEPKNISRFLLKVCPAGPVGEDPEVLYNSDSAAPQSRRAQYWP